MKALIAVIFSVLFFLTCYSQQYGAQWVLGDNISALDFRNDTLKNYAIQPYMPMFLTSADICDAQGNLLFYTNGIYVAGSDGNQIINGDSLSPCSYTNQWALNGLNIPQGALFLPAPGDSNLYYLIHFSNDTDNDSRPGTLYYSIIDQGYGGIVQKNISFFHGTIFRGGGMTACKHANGRDWWIVIGNMMDRYYTFLLTPNGISDTLIQTIGPSYNNPFNNAYSKFSIDGSRYVTSCAQGPILVMDFDRCSGEFSNPVVLHNPDNGAIVEFSPNDRFVYATNSLNLTQFDLLDTNPQLDSISLYQADSNDLAQMRMLQIAPNGKLYASCFAGGFYFLHVINNPDRKGDSCMYVDTGYVTLTANSYQLPNMINYNLGVLAGRCDTITSLSTERLVVNNELRVMPNPADKYVYVEMGMQGDYEFALLNTLGQVSDRKETRQVDIFDTERLANGIYFIQAVNRKALNNTIVKKLIIAH